MVEYQCKMEKDKIEKKIELLILKEYGIKEDVEVTISKDHNHGDYSTSIVLKLYSKYRDKIDKLDLFEKIKSVLSDYDVENLNSFINIFIKKNTLENIFRENNNKTKKIKEKVLVEYSSPNIAKTFSIGHLTTTIIGDSIYRMYKYLGYDTTNDNHIGDWGVQFGKLIYAIKEWGDDEIIESNPISELNKLYVRFHKEEEINLDAVTEAKEYYRKLSDGDKEITEYWKKIVDWSMQEFDKTYSLLGISFENTYGESFYYKLAQEIVDKALKDKKATIEDGAVVIYTKEDQKPLIVRKSDGTSLYSSHDLATIYYRVNTLKMDTIIYEIGVEQKQYIEQMFEAAKILGLCDNKVKLILISHGFMKLPGGEKMSTRKGNTIKLNDLIEQSREKTLSLLKERNITDTKIVDKIAIGAIKFNVLKRHYSSDIIFEWDKMLNFEGDTSVYIQYTYVRCLSLLRGIDIDNNTIKLETVEEQNLARELYKFNDYIDLSKLSPNILVEYLLNISKLYNLIYSKYNILKEENSIIRNTRLNLTKKTMTIIKSGLDLLGIETVEKM